jgi:hypothetical protein
MGGNEAQTHHMNILTTFLERGHLEVQMKGLTIELEQIQGAVRGD